MFGFLKDKLKGALGKFSKDVEKEATVEKKEVIIEQTPKDKKTGVVEEKKSRGFLSKIFGKKEEISEPTKNILKDEIIKVEIEKGKEEITTKGVIKEIIKHPIPEEDKIQRGQEPIIHKPEIKKPETSQMHKIEPVTRKIIPELKSEPEIHEIEEFHKPEKLEKDVHENIQEEPEEKKGF